MPNTLIGFDVEHNRYTVASSVQLHNTRFSKKMKIITKRHRTRSALGILVQSCGLVSLKLLKTQKKIVLNIVIKTFC